MTANRALIVALRTTLATAADPARAEGQQRYMKSEMPYYGITAPQLAALERPVFAAHPIEGYDDWRDTVLALFLEATHREERYCAISLADRREYRIHARRTESLDLYETLVVEGAWWDIVDSVASHLVGGLFETDAPWLGARMREWSIDRDPWKRRTSIICQLRRKHAVDLALLEDCIAPNLDDRDFFVRKAIGWALRETAKTHPQEVIRYVETHRDALSPLSKREALKNVLKAGLIDRVP